MIDDRSEMRAALTRVLEEVVGFVARPGNDFIWSSWEDSRAVVAELSAAIAQLRIGRLPDGPSLAVLFAPTGDLQEVAMASGWHDEYLAMSSRFDDAYDALYKHSR
jgi:hypothetical protein